MTYFDQQIFRFDGLNLSLYNLKTNNRANVTRQRLITLADGQIYDGFGSAQAGRQLPRPISLDGAMVANNATDYQTAINNLKAKLGVRGRLFRRRGDGTVEWVYARLSRIDDASESGQLFHRTMKVEFQQLSVVWNGSRHGDGWHLDEGELLDEGLILDEGNELLLPSSPLDVVVNNGGNAMVSNAVLKIINNSVAALTAFGVAKSGKTDIDLTSIDIPVGGGMLVLDCGKRSVTQNYQTWKANRSYALNDIVHGADGFHWKVTTAGTSGGTAPEWTNGATPGSTQNDNSVVWTSQGLLAFGAIYDNLAFGASHRISEWLRLSAGDNTLTCSYSGGGTGVTLEVEFYDGWQ